MPWDQTGDCHVFVEKTGRKEPETTSAGILGTGQKLPLIYHTEKRWKRGKEKEDRRKERGEGERDKKEGASRV